MSKNLSVRVSAAKAQLVKDRAAALRVSEGEYAGIVFELGWKAVTDALAQMEKEQSVEPIVD